MLAIKLKRVGKKHQASFRIIISEKRSKVDGRYVDDIGWLNPNSKEFNIKAEKAQHWIKNGAQPTDTVHNLFVKAGILSGPKRSVHKKKKAEEGAENKETGNKAPANVGEGSEKPASEPEQKSEEKKEKGGDKESQ